MSSYEEFYEGLKPAAKSLKDTAALIMRMQKAVQKNTEEGNLTEMKKNIDIMSDACRSLENCIKDVSEAISSFDTKEYFLSGDFTKQLLESCSEKGIDVRGEMGVYEMFPFKVRITGDEEHTQEVYINRKKLPSFRPQFIAGTIRKEQERLEKANFNPLPFMNEIAEGYETACLRSGSRIGSSQSLDKIYKYMTPMARARKEYDKQIFAYDLARIYEMGPDAWVTKAGDRYNFGTSRDGKTGIRVLNSAGVEAYISTLNKLGAEV